MKAVTITAAVAVLTFAAGSASAAHRPSSAPKPECFSVRQVQSFAAVDRETVNIRTDGNNYYQLKTLGPCGTIDFAFGAALQSRSGSSFVCNAMDIDVVAPSDIGPQRCQVSSIRRLTKADVAALPGKQRP